MTDTARRVAATKRDVEAFAKHASATSEAMMVGSIIGIGTARTASAAAGA